MDEPIDLERQGWSALSSGGDAARTFYAHVLDRTPVMLLPGGLLLDDRNAIIDSLSGPPWSSYELETIRSFENSPTTEVLVYGVVAERDGQRYSALMSSMYVHREDGWKLCFHQQTPR